MKAIAMNAPTGWTAPKFNIEANPLSRELAYLGPMTRDECLTRHLAAKEALEKAKALEMDLRKASVAVLALSAPAPAPLKEGVNNFDLGGGYVAKATVGYNYNLGKPDDVDRACSNIARISNTLAFEIDRIVSWTPTFHLGEYRKLQEKARGSDYEAKQAAEALKELSKVLEITDAAPKLEIKEPKGNRNG